MDRFSFTSKIKIQQPFTKLVRRASDMLRQRSMSRPPPLNGEIVYCKNNVCVHLTGSGADGSPIPGYLTLRCHGTENRKSTLLLCWIPNQTLSAVSRKPSRRPRIDSIKTVSNTRQDVTTTKSHKRLPSVEMEEEDLIVFIEHSPSLTSTSTSVDQSLSSNDDPLTGSDVENSNDRSYSNPGDLIKLTNGDSFLGDFHQSPNSSDDIIITQSGGSRERPSSLKLQDSADTLSISSGSTEGPDSQASSPYDSAGDSPTHLLTGTAEKWAVSHNLTFPDNNIHNEEMTPRASDFTVDLGSMRSLRLLYSGDSATCGQLVIASRESQYKIFHFYNGGLDKLAEVLEEWKLFHTPDSGSSPTSSPYSQQFKVVKPVMRDDSETHPDERLYEMVTPNIWKGFMNDEGRILHPLRLRKAIFFGGLQASLRAEVWPFLLHYYPYDSTFDEREQVRNDQYLAYQSIRKKREKLMRDAEKRERFWRSVQNTVEKDVVRTDRSHIFYKGEDNPNVETLKEILLNYAVQHPKLGYTQGMSDLLAPILNELKNESDSYWCFTGLMQRTIFVSSPRDHDMDRQLLYLKELLRLLHPPFYSHLMTVGEAVGMLFVHRWILLCFKREFSDVDSMCIWESCWTNLETDYFHLFIAVAIIASYSDDVINQKLPSDEMLLHFSSLSNHMNGKIMLRKARGLLHKFRLMERIPCTLQGLCSVVATGSWDSGHVPAVECVGHEGLDGCPYLSSPSDERRSSH